MTNCESDLSVISTSANSDDNALIQPAPTNAARTRAAAVVPEVSRSLDAADGNNRNGFIANDDLGVPTVSYVRAPADPRPANTGDDDEEGPCFLCRYCPTKKTLLSSVTQANNDTDTLEDKEITDAYQDLVKLIETYTNGDNGIAIVELVDIVSEFYEKEILTFYNCGEWSRKSIYMHAIHAHSCNEDAHLQENMRCLYAQIQGLRDRTWTHDSATQQTQPDLKVIYALERLVKTYSDQTRVRRQRQVGTK